jgi:electron transport complex protein RnfE
MSIFVMSPGGFFVLGCIIALVNKIAKRRPPEKIGCAGCPNAAACGQKGECAE